MKQLWRQEKRDTLFKTADRDRYNVDYWERLWIEIPRGSVSGGYMHKLARAVGLYVLGAMIISTNASPLDAQQPRTIDEVIGRWMENENHFYQRLKKYQPLVETYVQSFKPDKQLGYVP